MESGEYEKISEICKDEAPKIQEACDRLLSFNTPKMDCSGNVANYNVGIDYAYDLKDVSILECFDADAMVFSKAGPMANLEATVSVEFESGGNVLVVHYTWDCSPNIEENLPSIKTNNYYKITFDENGKSNRWEV